ncbi:unnamed protein product [Larinioides sclopetarius]|uniref:Uncharacterized protein n=1 Tax=Larinioides sclopetarius TaxID=280406 RepID=A0AAV2BWY1_9ARAC
MTVERNGEDLGIHVHQKPTKTNSFWHIDKEMLRFKIHFFLYLGGEGIGCILAGISFDYYGGHQTFFISAIFCASGFIASIFLPLFIRKQNRRLDVTQPQL